MRVFFLLGFLMLMPHFSMGSIVVANGQEEDKIRGGAGAPSTIVVVHKRGENFSVERAEESFEAPENGLESSKGVGTAKLPFEDLPASALLDDTEDRFLRSITIDQLQEGAEDLDISDSLKTIISGDKKAIDDLAYRYFRAGNDLGKLSLNFLQVLTEKLEGVGEAYLVIGKYYRNKRKLPSALSQDEAKLKAREVFWFEKAKASGEVYVAEEARTYLGEAPDDVLC